MPTMSSRHMSTTALVVLVAVVAVLAVAVGAEPKNQHSTVNPAYRHLVASTTRQATEKRQNKLLETFHNRVENLRLHPERRTQKSTRTLNVNKCMNQQVVPSCNGKLVLQVKQASYRPAQNLECSDNLAVPASPVFNNHKVSAFQRDVNWLHATVPQTGRSAPLLDRLHRTEYTTSPPKNQPLNNKLLTKHPLNFLTGQQDKFNKSHLTRPIAQARCLTFDVREDVMRMCDGRSNCQFRPDLEFVTKCPSPSTKYLLEMTYECVLPSETDE